MNFWEFLDKNGFEIVISIIAIILVIGEVIQAVMK